MEPFWGAQFYNYYYGYPMPFYQIPHQNTTFISYPDPYSIRFLEPKHDEKINLSKSVSNANENKIKIQERSDINIEIISKVKNNQQIVLKENQGQKKNKKDKIKANQKQYFKDDFRNVIPNIIYQIFSFLGKRYKSEMALNKILQLHFPNQDEKIKTMFYQYQKFLKNRLSKHLNQKSLQSLLKFADQLCVYYQHNTQIKMIKISILMVNYFLQTQHHLLQVICGKKIGKEKLKTYFIGFRRIKGFFDQKVILLKENQQKK